jgi:hypothetical protein
MGNYVTFEQAKWLKEKGFNLLLPYYYFEDGEFREYSLTGTNGYYGEEYKFSLSEFNENWNDEWLTKKSGDRCFGCSKDRGYFETFSAPEQHQVVEWLRVNHGIWISCYPTSNPLKCQFRIYKNDNGVMGQVYDDYMGKEFNSPQEAYSAAFDYLIKNQHI